MNLGISKEDFEQAVAEFENDSHDDDLCPVCMRPDWDDCGSPRCPYAEPDEEELEAELAEEQGRRQRPPL